MTVPQISIITATYAPSADYLRETADSIAAVELPAGWDLEWVVQEDGVSPQLAEELARFEFCRYEANHRQLGVASTRNLALSRAAGALVQALDQDDLLLSNVFTTLVPHFSQPAIHWAIGQADDLLPDGSRRPYPSPIPFGVLPAGSVNQWAAEQGGNWPIHGAAVMMRTTSVRALGGWAGIPSDDELALFAALSEMADGYYDETLTWLYRHHPKQTHRTSAVQALSEQGRRIVLQRAATIRELGLAFSPGLASGLSGANLNVSVGPNIKDTAL